MRKNGGEVQVFMNNADVRSTDEPSGVINKGSSKRNVNMQQIDTQEGAAQTEQTQSADQTSQDRAQPDSGSITENITENTADVIAADSGQNIYIVEAGDTLVSIAIKMYGDQTKADYIATVNELDIDTPIYEGQKIVIPYIE